MVGRTVRPERVFILGFDGVSWNRLRRWVHNGNLPAFERLFDEGAAGPLRSTTPATTPLAWSSVATGVWPDKHGIYGVQRLTEEYSHQRYTSDQLRQSPLWELVSPSVVRNVPLADSETSADRTSCEREGEVSHSFEINWSEYLNPLSEHYDDNRGDEHYDDNRGDERYENGIEHIAEQRELMERLFSEDDWRLAFFVFTAPKRLQQLIHDDDGLLSLYRRLDEVVEDAITHAETLDAAVFIVSGHGVRPTDRYANVNQILANDGILVSNADEIEYDTTEAFMNGSGMVFVNDDERFVDGAVPATERRRIKAVVAERLAGARDHETGEQPLTVYDGVDVFPADPNAPDLVVEAERYTLSAALTGESFERAGRPTGNNQTEGVLLAWGPGTAPGGRPKAAAVVDIAPTVLSALGEPVPESVVGRVLNSALITDSRFADRTNRTGRTNRTNRTNWTNWEN